MHWQAQSSAIQDVSAYLGGVTKYAGGSVVEQWQYTRVSVNTFRCFGIPVLEGRAFTKAEDLRAVRWWP